MARIVLGMAVPHSGMLRKPADTWWEDGERDRKNMHKMLWFRKKNWEFDDLCEARRNEKDWDRLLSIDEKAPRAARCASALDELARVYEAVKPDVAIIVGKDQKEIFIDTTPPLGIYTGETIHNGPPQRPVYAPDKDVTYPAYPELARYLLGTFKNDGFDMTEIMRWPVNQWMSEPKPIVPHAYSFIYHQIMRDEVPPNVPVFMNVFYPPNQPSFERSVAFARSLYKSISEWDSDKTVAIIASGGLSHFVCDEELDQQFLRHFQAYDFNALSGIDDRLYQSGTSEVKLYASVLWAMSELKCKMNLIDYVPCYRSKAGTGEGFAFMYWLPGR